MRDDEETMTTSVSTRPTHNRRNVGLWCLLLLMLAGCNPTIGGIPVPIERINPGVEEVIATLLTAARAQDAETVWKIRKFDWEPIPTVDDVATTLANTHGLWNYEDWALQTVYMSVVPPGQKWSVTVALHYSNGNVTPLEFIVVASEGSWKVTNVILPPSMFQYGQ